MANMKRKDHKVIRGNREAMDEINNSRYAGFACSEPKEKSKNIFLRPPYGKVGEVGACYAKVSG